MRLKLATAFALLFFAVLAFVLIKVSRSVPVPVTRPDPAESAPFAFDHTAVSGSETFNILEKFLRISPRHSGSHGATVAAEFIAAQLESAGLTPSVDIFTNITPAGAVTFRNVTATINGNTSNCIVLISHYDTKKGISNSFTGANDSGSSTALLLQLASVLKNSTSSVPDIVLAFVDGEECMEFYSASDGLHGSKRLAQKLSRKYNRKGVLAAIVLDMIGDRDLTVTVPKNCSSRLISRLFEAAHAENARDLFSLYNPILDDHVPFSDMGIPALDIIDFYYGSAPRLNDYWHTDEDSIDKIAPESLETIGRITIRLVNSLIANPL